MKRICRHPPEGCPVFFTPIYAIYLGVLVLPALTYAYLAVIGGNRINLGLLIATLFGSPQTNARG